MRHVEPEVFFIGETILRSGEVRRYLKTVGAESYKTNGPTDAEALTEFAGRLCYRSWEPGLNANVSKIREGNALYIGNILSSKHGSVLEHAKVVFVFHNVSRVFTHELVRHRVGVGISQESMRYVRLTDIPFWEPEWVQSDRDLMMRNAAVLKMLEEHQVWMAQHFKLDSEGVTFDEKKKKTSYMRRFAPEGVATGILWSCNFRNLRHIIALRTAKAAEEEIRKVFFGVGVLMKAEYPNHFQDFEINNDYEWVPKHEKV